MAASCKKSPLHLIVHKEAARIAETAVRSLLYEVSVSPKPGLVDRFDSGAHSDMDFFTYLDSTAALGEYFRSAFLLGHALCKKSTKELFSQLRQLGITAEQDMYQATGGINTHKGIIFTFGLFCGGLGWFYPQEIKLDEQKFLQFCGELAAPALKNDLAHVEEHPAATGGERMFAATGSAGIRSEAAAGYPSLLNYGLPALRKALKRGCSYNEAGIITLLELLCHVQDSNIFARCGTGKQAELIPFVKRILLTNCLDLSQVEDLNRRCIAQRISPGGCADLLAAAFFLHFYFDL